MIAANIARALLLLLLLTFRDAEQVWVAYLVAFFASVANLFLAPPTMHFYRSQFPKMNWSLQTLRCPVGENVARIVGPAVGGALMASGCQL